MKLIMTLLVRNEETIIDENIKFHRAQGVDRFIVMLHKSQDRTASILEKYVNHNCVEIIRQDAHVYDQAAWVTAMAQKAAKEYWADWVINNDADEFWIAREGTLKSFLESLDPSICTLSVGRFDFLYRPYKSAKFYEALLFREAHALWRKCAHRGAEDIRVEFGNHAAYAESFGAEDMQSYEGPAPIDVLHFPIRSKEHYREKVVAGSIDMMRTPSLKQEYGFHWKADAERVRNGSFDEYFKSKIYSSDAITKAIKCGAVVFDDRLQKFFLDEART
jgi:hypothetical protein